MTCRIEAEMPERERTLFEVLPGQLDLWTDYAPAHGVSPPEPDLKGFPDDGHTANSGLDRRRKSIHRPL